MTDRHAGYIVTLKQPIREDDAEEILTALRMVNGVISVKPVVADVMHHMAKTQARHELEKALWKALREEE